jgi:hypothetical protein
VLVPYLHGYGTTHFLSSETQLLRLVGGSVEMFDVVVSCGREGLGRGMSIESTCTVVLGHGKPYFAGPRPSLRLMAHDRIWRGCDQIGLRSCLISRLTGWKSPLCACTGGPVNSW